MNVFKKFKEKKLAKDSLLTLMGNLISQGISFVITVLLSRAMSVAEYGLYSVLNSLASFVGDMADMGMNGAITRFVAEYRAKDDLKSEEEIIQYSIRRKARNLFLVFIVLILTAKPIAAYMLHDESLSNYVYLIAISCGLSLFVGAMRAVLQGRQQYEKYFVSVVTWSVVWGLVIAGLYLTNRMTVVASVLAGAVGWLVNLVLCTKLVGIRVKGVLAKRQISPELKGKFNTFGNWMVLWSIFALLQSRADVFLLATLTTAEEVSYYEIATKVIKPVLMVTSSYAQVLNPKFASMKSLEELNKQIKSTMKFISAVCGLIVLAIMVVGPAVTLVFGDKYNHSIVPAQLLLFAIIFFVWTIPFNSALYAINKPEVFTVAALFGLIATVVGDILLLPSYGAIGAAVTYVLAQVIGLVVAVVAYKIFMKKVDSNGI